MISHQFLQTTSNVHHLSFVKYFHQHIVLTTSLYKYRPITNYIVLTDVHSAFTLHFEKSQDLANKTQQCTNIKFQATVKGKQLCKIRYVFSKYT